MVADSDLSQETKQFKYNLPKSNQKCCDGPIEVQLAMVHLTKYQWGVYIFELVHTTLVF